MSATQPRKLSDITRDFVGLQKSAANHKAGSPERQAILDRVKEVREEMLAALPPLDPAATAARERFIRDAVQAIDGYDRQAVEADIMAERSPHMRQRADEARRLAEKVRKGLDRAATVKDAAWWTQTMHAMASAENVARGLAGDSGFLRNQPKS